MTEHCEQPIDESKKRGEHNSFKNWFRGSAAVWILVTNSTCVRPTLWIEGSNRRRSCEIRPVRNPKRVKELSSRAPAHSAHFNRTHVSNSRGRDSHTCPWTP
ncbi:hypothetical protein U1Q18_030750 [Sarracenia purpurea var. burkii]